MATTSRSGQPPTTCRTTCSLHFRRMLTFDFGNSDADNRPIVERLSKGAGPSLGLTLPLFGLGLVLGIWVGLFVAFFRGTYIDTMGVLLCVLAMSVPILLYIIGAQYVIAKLLRWFPISGFDPSPELAARFLAIPILVGVVSGFGSSVRFYRTVFVEEVNRDYVRTARAKGASELRVMVRHVLRNSLIPILTNVVMSIPFLFTGSLLLEAFFGIPGLGSVTFDAIGANDFATLRTMVFIGALAFIVGQVLTDISYVLVDPRIRLENTDVGGAKLNYRWTLGALGAIAVWALLTKQMGGVKDAAKNYFMEDNWHYFSNGAVLLLGVAAIVVWRWSRRAPIWRQAFLSVCRRRKFAVAILSCYVVVGVVDSIAWTGGGGEDIVAAHKPASLLDRWFWTPRRRVIPSRLRAPNSTVVRRFGTRKAIDSAQISSGETSSTCRSRARALRC